MYRDLYIKTAQIKWRLDVLRLNKMLECVNTTSAEG